MAPSSVYDPHLLEREVEGFWKARRLPSVSGILGPPDGPLVHQFEGTFTPGEAPELVAQRAVAADADARFLALAGRRAVGILRWEAGLPEAAETAVGPLLRSLGVWVGGTGSRRWDVEPRHDGVEAIVSRLARAGIVVARDFPMRCCPTCAAPRSPERIVYQEEEGDAYLVRFDLPWKGGVAHGLVWVDAPWRLLGTTALLIHPELSYVVARYRRRDAEEVVFTSESSIERFREWLPESRFEILEERPGKEYAGRAYDYPLRHEFPMGGSLTPPAGTVLAVSDVTDTGTGIVPLVPGHGGTDAAIAEGHGVAGWPLVTPKGQLDVTLVHKYAGLDVTTANEFIVRDLTEGASVFAQLRVRRGVPHCVLCGTPLLWMPGRAWCLEPGRLPADRIELYRRLLPSAPALLRVEVAPWPISETEETEEPSGIALLECSRCERLDALDGPPACTCGGTKYPSRRRLLPALAGTLASWAQADPFPPDDSARVYLPERRRVPRFIHDLTAMAGIQGTVSNTSLTVLPTIPEIDLVGLVGANGADAVRAAFIGTERSDGATSSFVERCVQERRRLDRLWTLAQELLAMCDPAMVSSFAQPITGFLGELEVEDRAVLARWERARALALAAYDRFDPAGAHQRLFRFFENDLKEYRDWVRARLGPLGPSAGKNAVLRTTSYILRTGVELLAPITPYLAESVHRRFAGRASLFETAVTLDERGLRDDELVAAWERWRSVGAAVESFRHHQRIPFESPISAAALVVPTDDVGDQLRQDRPVLERLARVGRVDVGSPKEAWTGRTRRLVPVEPEIQRVYGAQASQIIHLLQRLPQRRTGEIPPPGELSVVIQGLSRQIPASMVEYRDTLPPGTVPVPWDLGEMYLELPARDSRSPVAPPPLSSDAFWLTRRVAHRLRSRPVPAGGALPVAVVAATDPLASELRSAAEPLARYLGLAELRVLDTVEEPLPRNRVTGRTHTGARWWVHVPGMPGTPPRAKHRSVRASRRRVPARSRVGELPPLEVDYADGALVAREASIRELNEELDGLLGVPLVGPTKVRAAWEVGIQSVDGFRQAPFETVAALPGFGHTLAATLADRLGGAAPPARPRHSRPASALQPPTPTRTELSVVLPAVNGGTRVPTAPLAESPPTTPRSTTHQGTDQPAARSESPVEVVPRPDKTSSTEGPLWPDAVEEPPLSTETESANSKVAEPLPMVETVGIEPPPSVPTVEVLAPAEAELVGGGGLSLLPAKGLPEAATDEPTGGTTEIATSAPAPEEIPSPEVETQELPATEPTPPAFPSDIALAVAPEPSPEEGGTSDGVSEPDESENSVPQPDLAPAETPSAVETPGPSEAVTGAQSLESTASVAPALSPPETARADSSPEDEIPPEQPASS
ncbi:MAG: class I tRNA ligase family protein, partial [Thermoplasmata archaeon]